MPLDHIFVYAQSLFDANGVKNTSVVNHTLHKKCRMNVRFALIAHLTSLHKQLEITSMIRSIAVRTEVHRTQNQIQIYIFIL